MSQACSGGCQPARWALRSLGQWRWAGGTALGSPSSSLTSFRFLITSKISPIYLSVTGTKIGSSSLRAAEGVGPGQPGRVASLEEWQGHGASLGDPPESPCLGIHGPES